MKLHNEASGLSIKSKTKLYGQFFVAQMVIREILSGLRPKWAALRPKRSVERSKPSSTRPIAAVPRPKPSAARPMPPVPRPKSSA